MSVSVNKLAEAPVVVATFDARADARDVATAYLETLQFAWESSEPLHRIINVEHTGSAYQTVVYALRELTKAAVGAALLPEMIYTFVGQAQMAAYFDEQHLPFFSSMDAALNDIRSRSALTYA